MLNYYGYAQNIHCQKIASLHIHCQKSPHQPIVQMALSGFSSELMKKYSKLLDEVGCVAKQGHTRRDPKVLASFIEQREVLLQLLSLAWRHRIVSPLKSLSHDMPR
jgi:hypothetical protein